MANESFNFGANADDLQEEDRMPMLDVPFLGDSYLKDVRIDNELGGDNYRVLQLDFVCLPPNEAGFSLESPKEHTVTMWEPDEEDTIPGDGDDPSNIQKMLNTLAYRLKYWIGSEEEAAEVVQMQGDSLAEAWDNLRERVVKAMDPYVPGDKVDNPREEEGLQIVKIKVLGSVYFSSQDQQQKSSLGMPPYKGHISNEDSEYPVSLSPNEKDGNKEWAEFQSSTPSSTEDVAEDEEYEF